MRKRNRFLLLDDEAVNIDHIQRMYKTENQILIELLGRHENPRVIFEDPRSDRLERWFQIYLDEMEEGEKP